MPHLFSRTFKDPLRIMQVTAVKEAEVDVVSTHRNVANTVFHHFVRRAVVERDGVHFENVFTARRQFFEY